MDEPKPKRPWSAVQYLIIIVVAFFLAVCVLWPVGHRISGVFQELIDAFRYGK